MFHRKEPKFADPEYTIHQHRLSCFNEFQHQKSRVTIKKMVFNHKKVLPPLPEMQAVVRSKTEQDINRILGLQGRASPLFVHIYFMKFLEDEKHNLKNKRNQIQTQMVILKTRKIEE